MYTIRCCWQYLVAKEGKLGGLNSHSLRTHSEQLSVPGSKWGWGGDLMPRETELAQKACSGCKRRTQTTTGQSCVWCRHFMTQTAGCKRRDGGGYCFVWVDPRAGRNQPLRGAREEALPGKGNSLGQEEESSSRYIELQAYLSLADKGENLHVFMEGWTNKLWYLENSIC